MTIFMCLKCKKLISITVISGGNPTAKENPDLMTMYYGKCERCGKVFCEECLKSNEGKCLDCNRGKVPIQGPPP